MSLKSCVSQLKAWSPVWTAALLVVAVWTMVGAQDQTKANKVGSGETKGESKPPMAQGRPFGDKIVSVYTKGVVGGMGHNLEDVSLVLKAGKQFLVGTGVDDGSWTRGLHVEIAWDEIASVIVYESLEQFNERTREAGAEHGMMGGVMLPELPGGL